MAPYTKTIRLAIIAFLILPAAGCRMGYILHAISGQYSMLHNAVPIEEALKEASLDPALEQNLRMVGTIKEFGEKVLGLKATDNYETVNLKTKQAPVYTVSACPKDSLAMVTWWFPVVGAVPYLGFFDLEKANAEKEKLQKEGLDVVIWRADAYSTLGWFRDPITLNLLKGTTLDMADTILHEMTHTTLYVEGQPEFNEGLAQLVGKWGAYYFAGENYGPSHAYTVRAKKIIADERLFSSFVSSLLTELEILYQGPLTYEEKLQVRQEIFSRAGERFRSIRKRFKTERFAYFGGSDMNNAYLLSIALYHRHFHLFESVLEAQGSIAETLRFFKALAEQDGDLIARTAAWLKQRRPASPVITSNKADHPVPEQAQSL